MDGRDEAAYLVWEAIPERCRPCDRARFMVVTQRINLLRGTIDIEHLLESVSRAFDDCPSGAMALNNPGEGVVCNNGESNRNN